MLGKLIGKLVPGHRGHNLLSSVQCSEARTTLVVISYCPALTLIGVRKIRFFSLLYSLEIIRLHRGRKLWKFIYLLYKQDVVSVRMQNSA